MTDSVMENAMYAGNHDGEDIKKSKPVEVQNLKWKFVVIGLLLTGIAALGYHMDKYLTPDPWYVKMFQWMGF